MNFTYDDCMEVTEQMLRASGTRYQMRLKTYADRPCREYRIYSDANDGGVVLLDLYRPAKSGNVDFWFSLDQFLFQELDGDGYYKSEHVLKEQINDKESTDGEKLRKGFIDILSSILPAKMWVDMFQPRQPKLGLSVRFGVELKPTVEMHFGYLHQRDEFHPVRMTLTPDSETEKQALACLRGERSFQEFLRSCCRSEIPELRAFVQTATDVRRWKELDDYTLDELDEAYRVNPQ